jgi:hypothetical protein
MPLDRVREIVTRARELGVRRERHRVRCILEKRDGREELAQWLIMRRVVLSRALTMLAAFPKNTACDWRTYCSLRDSYAEKEAFEIEESLVEDEARKCGLSGQAEFAYAFEFCRGGTNEYFAIQRVAKLNAQHSDALTRFREYERNNEINERGRLNVARTLAFAEYFQVNAGRPLWFERSDPEQRKTT